MIYVTHDQSEAMTMSDRIAVFNAGHIEQVGPPSAVYFSPVTRFVASFVGDSNLFEGVVAAGRDAVDVPDLGEVPIAPTDLAPGRVVTVLIRPEMFHLRSPQEPAGAAMTVREVVNYGDSMLVLGRIGARDVRVRTPGRSDLGLGPGMVCGLDWSSRPAHVIG